MYDAYNEAERDYLYPEDDYDDSHIEYLEDQIENLEKAKRTLDIKLEDLEAKKLERSLSDSEIELQAKLENMMDIILEKIDEVFIELYEEKGGY